MIDCSPSALVAAAACFQCLRGLQWSVRTSLLCQWANTVGATDIILMDANGLFWKLVIDSGGNIGTVSDPGPQTGPWILDDGVGGLWQLVVDVGGLRGTTGPVAGPATAPVPTLNDGLQTWDLVVDAAGNLGATM